VLRSVPRILRRVTGSEHGGRNQEAQRSNNHHDDAGDDLADIPVAGMGRPPAEQADHRR